MEAMARTGTPSLPTAPGEDGARTREEWEVFGAALARLARGAREGGGELVVAQCTTRDEDMNRRLRAACAELQVPFVDLLPALAAAPTVTHFQWDGHWRPIGHRIAAAVLLPEVEAQLRR
jgi:hypothetical protein